MTVLLVRHARAGRRDRWHGDDRARPLTKRGRRQADGLRVLLAPWTGAGAHPLLLSSPWLRCVQTLVPLGTAVDEAVTARDVLGEGMGAEAVDALPGWLGERPVVLCTHGDVIADLLGRLGHDGVDVGSAPRAAKGSVWVLDGAGGTVRTARYLPPAT